MLAGLFKQRIRLEARAAANDGYGNREGAWVPQFSERAAYKPLRGSEEVQAHRLAGIQPVVITVYASSRTRRITPAWRVVDARTGTIYNIRSIEDMEQKNRTLDLLTESGVADG